MASAKKVFISYSSKDKVLREKLESHLTLLRRGDYISTWSDRLLEAGDDWDSEIKTALEEAEILLFLISDDFLNSQYIWNVEIQNAMDRVKDGNIKVIPIVLRPCEWKIKKRGSETEYVFPFARYQGLPDKGKPVVEWESEDSAFANVAASLKRMIDNMDK